MCQAVDALHDTQNNLLIDIWTTPGNTDLLNRQYDETVVELLQHLGDEAPASRIDMAQYETFSNLYKDETGTRPKDFSYRQMIEWMDAR